MDDEHAAAGLGLSARSLIVVVLKIIGILYLLYAAGEAVRLLSIASSGIKEFQPLWERAWIGLTLVVDLGLALVFLLHAEWIARWMIREDHALPVLTIGPHRALWLGVGLIGTWIAANDLGLLLNVFLELFWKSGRLAVDERRELILSGLKSLCFVAIGVALFLRAAKRLGIRSALRWNEPDAEPEASAPQSEGPRNDAGAGPGEGPGTT
jgi:hypothetical protein